MLANRERASKMCAWETTVSGYKYILVNRYTHHSSMTTVSNKISLQSKNLRISYAKTTVFSCQILLHHYIRIALTIILQNYPHSKSMIYPSNIHFLMDCSPNEPMSQCCHTSTETVRFIWDGEPRTATSTFTQLLNSESFNVVLCPQDSHLDLTDRVSMLLYIHGTATLTFTEL